MQKSLLSSKQQISLNENSISDLIDKSQDQSTNSRIPKNLTYCRNKRPKIQKSFIDFSSMDEPLSIIKQESKKESFSDSLMKEEFNFNSDTKIIKNIKEPENVQNNYTYTKKKINLPKHYFETQSNSERKKFINYCKNNYPKAQAPNNENEKVGSEPQNEISVYITRSIKTIFERKKNNSNNVSEFNYSTNSHNSNYSKNALSNNEQSKKNDLFSSSSSGSRYDRHKRFKIKRSQVSYDSLPREEDCQLPKSLNLQGEKSKKSKSKSKKKLIKNKSKKVNQIDFNSININIDENAKNFDNYNIENPKTKTKKTKRIFVKGKKEIVKPEDKISKIIKIQKCFRSYKIRKNRSASKIQSFWRGTRVRNIIIFFRVLNNFNSILNNITKNNLKKLFNDFKNKLNEYKNNKESRKNTIVTKKIKSSKLKSRTSHKTKRNNILENIKFEIDKNRYNNLLETEKNYENLSKEYDSLIKKYSELKDNNSIIINNINKSSRNFRLLGSPLGTNIRRNILADFSKDNSTHLMQEKESLQSQQNLLYQNYNKNTIPKESEENAEIIINTNKYEENQKIRKKIIKLKKPKKFKDNLQKSRNEIIISSSFSRNNTLSEDRTTRDSSDYKNNNCTIDKEVEQFSLIEKQVDFFTIYSSYENDSKRDLDLDNEIKIISFENNFNENAFAHKFQKDKLLLTNENCINIIQKKKNIKKNKDKIMPKSYKKKINNDKNKIRYKNKNILIEVNEEQSSNENDKCNISWIKSIFNLKDKIIILNRRKNGKALTNYLVKNSIISHIIQNDEIMKKKRLLNAFNKFKNNCFYERILDSIKTNKAKNLMITKISHDYYVTKKKPIIYKINKVINDLSIFSKDDSAKSRDENNFIISKKINYFQINANANDNKKRCIKIESAMSIAIVKKPKLINLSVEKPLNEISIKGNKNSELIINNLNEEIKKLKMQLKLNLKFQKSKCLISKDDKFSIKKVKPKPIEFKISKNINDFNILNKTPKIFKNPERINFIDNFIIKRENKKQILKLNKVDKFCLKSKVKNRNSDNLFITRVIKKLSINGNASLPKDQTKKFDQEPVITKIISNFKIVKKKPQEYIISKIAKNVFIEGKIVTAPPKKNNFIITKVNKQFNIKNIKRINENIITKVNKFNIKSYKKVDNPLVINAIKSFNIKGNENKRKETKLFITKEESKISIFGNKNRNLFLKEEKIISNSYSYVKYNKQNLIITKTISKFNIINNKKQIVSKQKSKANEYIITKTKILNIKNSINDKKVIDNDTQTYTKLPNNNNYIINKRYSFSLSKIKINNNKNLEIIFCSNLTISNNKEENKDKQNLKTENKLKKMILPLKLKNILKKNTQIIFFHMLINRAKLITVEKNKNKEEKNKGKKITFRFQGIKVIKKKSRKDIFRPLVNKIQLKNEMKNKFIYWKKLTKKKEKEMESSSQESEIENENDKSSFFEKTCKMQ